VYLKEIHSLQEFVRNPWDAEVSKDGTVQIHVPKLAVFDTGPRIAARNVGVGSDSAMEVVAASSNLVPAKRTLVLQKKAVEVYAANDCSGDLEVSVKDLNEEDHDHHSASITCHMCYLVEVGKSERAKMLSCKCCGKKYHRNCVKSWAQHRDLFNWSSWACPSCRICEGCGTLGDPKKFMFCKRCDDAYHCDCQHPRHKNVSSGPYLCPKHTKCYSCESTVPGNGQSLRYLTFCLVILEIYSCKVHYLLLFLLNFAGGFWGILVVMLVEGCLLRGIIVLYV
jgi:hypothetical protein